MNHELIDFDIAKNAQMLMDMAKLPPGTRNKPVAGDLRGIGGGKTRALEELQRFFYLKEGVLSLAITFNNHTTYVQYDLWPIQNDQHSLSYELSIICRFASFFFRVKFDQVFYRMK
jgi:hypothetical protein